MYTKSTNIIQLETPSETRECFTLAEWCWLNPRTKGKLIHIPNEGKRTPREGGKLKRMGLRPGTSDYFLAVPMSSFSRIYGGMFIEMKRRDQRKSRISPLQAEFIHDMRMGGYYAAVTYGADEAIELVTKYLNAEL